MSGIHYPAFSYNANGCIDLQDLWVPTNQFEEMLHQIEDAHLDGCHQILSQEEWPQELTPQPVHNGHFRFMGGSLDSALALHKLRCHVKRMCYNPLAFIKSQGFNAHEAQAIAHAAYPHRYEQPTLAMLLG